jgi:hypothetical protein
MNKLAALLSAFLLVGCATDTMPVLVRPGQVNIPTVDPLTLNRIEWRVLTDEQLRELLNQRENVLFALDAEGYRAMSLNLIEIRRYIDEQRAVINYLRRILDERAGITTAPETRAAPLEAPTPSTTAPSQQ